MKNGLVSKSPKLQNWIRGLQQGTFKEFAAISDIHGNLGTFKALVDMFLNLGITRFRLNGDYIDLDEEHNIAVLRFLKSLKEQQYGLKDEKTGKTVYAEDVVILLGNHDLKFIQTMIGSREAFVEWIKTGGLYVLQEAKIEHHALIHMLETIVKKIERELQGNPVNIIGKRIGLELNQFIRENPQAIADLMDKARQQQDLMALAGWLLNTGKLYFEDENGILFVHAGLPMGADGKVNIENYKGVAGLSSLDSLLEDFRKSGVLIGRDVTPAGIAPYSAVFSSIMNLAELDFLKQLSQNPQRAQTVLDQLHINCLIVGHKKQDRLFSIGGAKIFGIDLTMPRYYGSHGGALQFSQQGITVYKVHKGQIEIDTAACLSKDQLIAELTNR